MSDVKEGIVEAIRPRWVDAPRGVVCSACGSDQVDRLHVPFTGPWSGSVRCRSCGFKETVCSKVGRAILTVEPILVGKVLGMSESERPWDALIDLVTGGREAWSAVPDEAINNAIKHGILYYRPYVPLQISRLDFSKEKIEVKP